MADEAKLYRERADAERVIAADTTLPNVRDRALHSAARWDELAGHIERSRAIVAERAANSSLNAQTSR
ncbi:MAG: hypothetical protein EOO77_04920 [Oxalobacteraceae bacterium]|nr:MAG: hypothetical protein EOO77_04920 [Oxalobacteraceae bacterium]